jgi:hypothetical protein
MLRYVTIDTDESLQHRALHPLISRCEYNIPRTGMKHIPQETTISVHLLHTIYIYVYGRCWHVVIGRRSCSLHFTTFEIGTSLLQCFAAQDFEAALSAFDVSSIASGLGISEDIIDSLGLDEFSQVCALCQ